MRRKLILGLAIFLCGCLPSLTVESSRTYLGSGERFAICAESSAEVTITLDDIPVSGEYFDDGQCQWLTAPYTSELNHKVEYRVAASNAAGTSSKIVEIYLNVPVSEMERLSRPSGLPVYPLPWDADFVHEIVSLRIEPWEVSSIPPEWDLTILNMLENLQIIHLSRMDLNSLTPLLQPEAGSRFLPFAQLESVYLDEMPSLTDISALSNRPLKQLTLGELPITELPPLLLKLESGTTANVRLNRMSFPDWQFLNQLHAHPGSSGTLQNTQVQVSLRDVTVNEPFSISELNYADLSLRADPDSSVPVLFRDLSYDNALSCNAQSELDALFDQTDILYGCNGPDPAEMTTADIPTTDPAFKACLEQDILPLSEVEHLGCNVEGIASLSGIEYLQNLFWFGISESNRLVNLDALETLDKLGVFAFHGDSPELEDIGGLLNLPALREIVIFESPKVDCFQAGVLQRRLGEDVADIESCRYQ